MSVKTENVSINEYFPTYQSALIHSDVATNAGKARLEVSVQVEKDALIEVGVYHLENVCPFCTSNNEFCHYFQQDETFEILSEELMKHAVVRELMNKQKD